LKQSDQGRLVEGATRAGIVRTEFPSAVYQAIVD